MNYEQRYKKVNLFFDKYPTLLNIFYKLYKYLPLIIAEVYAVLVVYTFFFKNWECTIKVVLVPLVTFISVSVLRKVIDSKRPYVKYNITPLIKKDKQSESFPSRHTVSATIIAMSCLYINVWLGIVMLIASCIMAIMRVLAGVHFAKDVIAALIFGIVFGIIVFWIF